MSNSRRLLAAFLIASPAFAQIQLFEAVEPHMGTLVRIKLYARDANHANAAFRKAFDRIAELDAILSDYKPESELKQLSKAAAHPIPISSDLFRVLEIAQDVAAKSDGAFDITLGAVTRLWRKGQVPDVESIREALLHTGFRKLHLDAATHTVKLDDPKIRLDAGGIGKGYAAEAALAVLKTANIRSALIAISGDLAIGAPPSNQKTWKISISGAVRELANCFVSTSGDSEQHTDAKGKRYSHIVNPATGFGLKNSTTTTVIATSGALADALSTAVNVLGPKRAQSVVSHYNAELVTSQAEP